MQITRPRGAPKPYKLHKTVAEVRQAAVITGKGDSLKEHFLLLPIPALAPPGIS